MKVIKRVLNISFCFCILAGCLASCSQDEESVTNVSRTETEGINKDAILAFSSKVGCSKFKYKSDTKSARIQLVKLLIFNTLYCQIVL